MAKSINDVVEDLRTGHKNGRSQAVLAALLADKVEMVHHPREPTDGVMDAAVLGPAMAADQLLQAAPGLCRELTAIKVDGDRIDMDTRIVGDLPNGVRVDVPFRIVCTVRDGEIVRIDSHPDLEASQTLKDFAMAQMAASQAS